MTPIWLPSSPIRRTSGTRMRSLIRVWSRSGSRRSNLRGTGTSCLCGGASSGAEPVVIDLLDQREGSIAAGGSSQAPAGDQIGDAPEEVVHGHRTGVPGTVLAHADLAGLLLAVAD